MVVMEEKSWARVGQGLVGAIALAGVGTGLYFGYDYVRTSAKSAGAQEAESVLTGQLDKDGRLLPENGCLRYGVAAVQQPSEHYQGTGKCEGLDFVVNLDSTKRPTSLVVEGFNTRLTLQPDAPYVTGVQRRADAWTSYASLTGASSNP